MAKNLATITFATLNLDYSSSKPIYRQLYDGMQEAILTGKLPAGTRIPSTRSLATELGVSRNTVMTAFNQLLIEGYLEGKMGAGTYVSRSLPDDLLQARAVETRSPMLNGKSRELSRRGTVLAATPATATIDQGAPRAFRPGIPALDAFPSELWSRLATRYRGRFPPRLLSYGEAAGYWPLREAIADYLRAVRAVRCEAEQVIVVSGSQQGLDLTARVLLDPGETAWVEEPGYVGARGALLGASIRLVPVPVDEEGLDVAVGMARDSGARLAYVSPSHQFPLGATMSLTRRLALLEWASSSGAWILEDDYDSEYRYAGRPLASLQGLDTEGRVIYLGTFSKVLFPALRLGYMVVPSDLVDAFVAARELSDRHSPTLEQATLTEFIVEGHFERHIRRMRKLYAQRQAVLVEASRQELAGLLEVGPSEAGLHLVGWLPASVDDLEASQRAGALDVEAPALSLYCRRPNTNGGLLLGYAAVNDGDIREGVRRLATALG